MCIRLDGSSSWSRKLFPFLPRTEQENTQPFFMIVMLPRQVGKLKAVASVVGSRSHFREKVGLGFNQTPSHPVLPTAWRKLDRPLVPQAQKLVVSSRDF